MKTVRSNSHVQNHYWIQKIGGWLCNKCNKFVATGQPITCKCDEQKP